MNEKNEHKHRKNFECCPVSWSGLKGRSLYVKSKSTVTKSSHMSRMSQMPQMSQTCLLITLIKCLKGHKSLGSLGSVVKGLIVNGVGRTKGQGHLLSCSGQLKTNTVSGQKHASCETSTYFMWKKQAQTRKIQIQILCKDRKKTLATKPPTYFSSINKL